MVKHFSPHSSHKITTEGYNLSFIKHPYFPNKYLATIRQVEVLSYTTYPTIKNTCFLLELNSDFYITSTHEMKECLAKPRNTYESFTIGLEDFRIINQYYMLAGTLDATDQWNPEMCLIKYDWSNGNIEELFVLENTEKTPQKNWLVMNETTTHFTILHSYDPLTIITVEKDNGSKHMLHFQKVFNLENCEMHGGGCVYLYNKKQYLVCVRVVYSHTYKYSLWLLFNEKYKIIGSSEPFSFFEMDPQNVHHYEMCMSVVEKNNFILVSVSLNDEESYILQYQLADILELIEHKQNIQS